MLAPGLSMLWEDADATSALRERFGFADLDEVSGWAGDLLRRSWGLRAGPCSRLVLSGDNAVAWVHAADVGPLVLKFSCAADRFARLDATTTALDHLSRAGVPVAAPRRTPDGTFRVRAAGPGGDLSTGVFLELAGDWLDVSDAAAVHDAGAWLARTHAALAGLTTDVPPRAAGTLRYRVGAWLTAADPGHVPDASRRLARLLSRAPDLPEAPQVVHGDFRAANVLVRDSRVVGILDLDDAHRAHRVEDLAQASVYLATRFRGWRPTPPEVRRSLLAGYTSVRPLSPVERRWLDLLVLWFGLCAVPGPDDAAGWAVAVG